MTKRIPSLGGDEEERRNEEKKIFILTVKERVTADIFILTEICYRFMSDV